MKLNGRRGAHIYFKKCSPNKHRPLSAGVAANIVHITNVFSFIGRMAYVVEDNNPRISEIAL